MVVRLVGRNGVLVVVVVIALAGCTAPELGLDLESSDESSDAWGDEITKPSVPDPSWGAWAAEAGATNVTGPTYLPIQGTAPVRVRFTESAFRGVDDPTWTVPIEGNLVMGWGTSRADFRWTNASTVVLPISPDAPQLVVNYRIRQVPDVLLAQEYRAGYVIEQAALRDEA